MNAIVIEGQVKLEMKLIFHERDVPLAPVGLAFGVAGLTSGCGLEELHFLQLIHFFTSTSVQYLFLIVFNCAFCTTQQVQNLNMADEVDHDELISRFVDTTGVSPAEVRSSSP
jgi:hypothetical protein